MIHIVIHRLNHSLHITNSHFFYSGTTSRITKNKKTHEEKLAQKREIQRNIHKKIKNNPDKYALYKEKERQRYLKRKKQNKLKSIADMTPKEKLIQRKRWKENSMRFYYKKAKHKRGLEECPTPIVKEENEHSLEDPLEIL